MAKTLCFTKMHGLGNDFIIVEGKQVKELGLDYSTLSKKMCDRKFGIGGDGLIIVNPPEIVSEADVSWRIINSDGSEPQMCGNGIRCFAKYAYEKGVINKKKFTVWTLAGIITPEILDNGEVKVNMGAPILEAVKVPVKIDKQNEVINYPLTIKDRVFNINAVSMGNPHCIIFSDEDTELLAKEYGPLIEKHELFPEKTNVEFVKILAKDKIKIDVWERGCGITLACGTGACASTVAGIVNNLIQNKVTAELPGGTLEIEWQQSKEGGTIYMSGPAEFVFFGEYLLEK